MPPPFCDGMIIGRGVGDFNNILTNMLGSRGVGVAPWECAWASWDLWEVAGVLGCGNHAAGKRRQGTYGEMYGSAARGSSGQSHDVGRGTGVARAARVDGGDERQ